MTLFKSTYYFLSVLPFWQKKTVVKTGPDNPCGYCCMSKSRISRSVFSVSIEILS